MNGEKLEDKTKRFALAVIETAAALPRGKTVEFLAGELLRSGTSVAASYRAARRAKSRDQFIEKLGQVELDADAAAYWTELLIDNSDSLRIPAQVVSNLQDLMKESDTVLAMTFASIKTLKQKGEK